MLPGERNPLSRYLELWGVIEHVFIADSALSESIAVPRMVTGGAPNAINSVPQCVDSVSRPARLASPIGVHRARSLRTRTHPSPSPSVEGFGATANHENGNGCTGKAGSVAVDFVDDQAPKRP